MNSLSSGYRSSDLCILIGTWSFKPSFIEVALVQVVTFPFVRFRGVLEYKCYPISVSLIVYTPEKSSKESTQLSSCTNVRLSRSPTYDLSPRDSIITNWASLHDTTQIKIHVECREKRRIRARRRRWWWSRRINLANFFVLSVSFVLYFLVLVFVSASYSIYEKFILYKRISVFVRFFYSEQTAKVIWFLLGTLCMYTYIRTYIQKEANWNHDYLLIKVTFVAHYRLSPGLT